MDTLQSVNSMKDFFPKKPTRIVHPGYLFKKKLKTTSLITSKEALVTCREILMYKLIWLPENIMYSHLLTGIIMFMTLIWLFMDQDKWILSRFLLWKIITWYLLVYKIIIFNSENVQLLAMSISLLITISKQI